MQKEIAIALKDQGWGNDLSTGSGLLNSGGRQMNIDLVHRVGEAWEFIELKIDSNDYFNAAMQVLRY